MEATVVADALTLSASPGQSVFTKHLLHRAVASHNSSAGSGSLQISGLISPIDAVAPPPVRSTTSPRTLVKRRLCRTRRRRCPSSGVGSEDGELFGGEDGNDDNGTFGGSGGGGCGWGGRGWNFDGFRGFGWDDSSSYPADPAFDFVYEVVCWLVLSNCLHFAYRKVARLVAAGIDGHGREKVPMRMTPVC